MGGYKDYLQSLIKCPKRRVSVKKCKERKKNKAIEARAVK